MEPAAASKHAGRRDAGRGAGGVVPRPALYDRLGGAARVTVVSAPAGSGKTVLLRSWLSQAALDGRAAWVPTGRGERDAQRFWVSVAGALRQTTSGAGLVRAVSGAPELDGWDLVERLLEDLAPLDGRLWLVIDDVHELGSSEALRQLELLVMRAPSELRFVFAARHDLRLGLHRLRLEGELAEIRARDLKFTLAEAGQLMATAGVELPDPVLAALHERTEGWAAGLRLAALALAGHPDPVRFAAEFSGTERTVAEYLLAEVLERQSDQVRRVLLRTSVLERVNGELASLLTGDDGGERVLQDLEQAGSFVVSLDPARTWFRYHQMFAGLLRLELRRAEPGEVAGLHAAAVGWFASHGFGVEAIRHAQAAGAWDVATRLLVEHWPGLHLDGQAGTVHELLTGFSASLLSADAEFAVVAAADELAQGSLEVAEQYLDLAQRSDSVPEARRGQLRLLLGVVSLLLAGQRGNLPGVTEQARRLAAMTEGGDAAQPGLTEDLRALALITLGSTEFWAAAPDDAVRHLEQGVALSRRIGRPYLEFTGLANLSGACMNESFERGAERATEAVELARRHGWIDDPAFGVACLVLGAVLSWQARLEEAERSVQGAERLLGVEAAQPAMAATTRFIRGVIEMLRNRDSAALAAFQAADLLARQLASPHYLIPRIQAFVLRALVRLGQTGPAGQLLAGLSDPEREQGEIRIAEAALRLAQDDPRAATAALERALDLAEPDGQLSPFLLHPAPGLLARHVRYPTTHASLLADIQSLLSGTRPAPPARPQPLLEVPSESELRVLRYLPTNLTVPEIARELQVSVNTVKTHVRNLFAKFGTHSRTETVRRARALSLLAPAGLRQASRHHRPRGGEDAIRTR